ncbi:MAG TPA: alpha/beta hydrolase [Puia sp.]|nr:alpha/beta hydrolase [Puia sp.]
MKQFFCTTIFLLLGILSFSQNKQNDLPEKRWMNVAYGSFPSSIMDIALPANRDEHTPFVIIIHAGGWVLGDKIWGARTQDTLLAHGIASANMNYRFADDGQVHWQQMLEDVDSVLDYCISHADEWHTRKNNFIMNGESAGAHLALLYGYTTPKKIAAIVSECGPTNLTDTAVLNYYAKNDTALLHDVKKMVGADYPPGGSPGPEYAAASPVFHVKNLPTLFFHGTSDQLVPYTQATDLENELKRKGYIYKFVPMPGANHDLGLNVLESRTFIYREFVEWVWKYGK